MEKEVQKKISDPIRYIKGVGSTRARILGRLGIETIEDFLYYLPEKYSDRSKPVPIAQVQKGKEVTIRGKVKNAPKSWLVHPRLEIIEVSVDDGTGEICLSWFNQPFIKSRLPIGTEIVVNGKVDERKGRLYLRNFDYEILPVEENVHTLRIVPIYAVTEGISRRHMRIIAKRVINGYIPYVPEILPEEIRNKYHLSPASEAFSNAHFPESIEKCREARKQLTFSELFLFQVGLALKKRRMRKEKKDIRYRAKSTLPQQFIKVLPFKLTKSQERVIDEISYDMDLPKPMNRLLQGDVGSGKTVVAAWAMLKAIESGYQTAIMAPTEILAQQHYLNFRDLLKDLRIRVELLIGSVPEKEKKWLCRRIKDGQVDIAIGTHALIQKGVDFANLGLVVVDEQHKFGVIQRSTLRKKGLNSDMLVMTATPIPRSLALTVYGDLDISTIDEMPPGRKEIETYVLPPEQRENTYKFVAEEIARGRQAYVVCPLVEESLTSSRDAAVQMYERLQKEIFPKLRLGLIHGQMDGNKKDEIMTNFKEKKIDILVSTIVIEVGIDIPNASVMLIENAESFGLPQLHQLRGRIGRGPYQSYCLLLPSQTEGLSEDAKERVSIMRQTGNGFKIAEKDLEIRGPGSFFGTKQHGLLDIDIRVADIVKDRNLLEGARKEAFSLIEKCPTLYKPEYKPLKAALRKKFKGEVEIS